MKFTAVRISNFRAIREFAVDDLTGLVVISGPNGSGKSCVFDALRLLKSVYGGYQPNEHLQWMSEFQLDIASPTQSVVKTLRDRSRPAVIEASLRLADEERSFLLASSRRLCTVRAWAMVLGKNMEEVAGYTPEGLSLQYPQRVPDVDQIASQLDEYLCNELAGASEYELSLTITADGAFQRTDSPVAEIIFQTYEPQHLGIVDYHSASRGYQREGLGGITLDRHATAASRRGTALYGANSKYQGVKGELANAYLQQLVAREAGDDFAGRDSELGDALAELFRTFFPDKSFEGVVPKRDGTIDLPVRLSTGEQHDINELSSGEKEIVFGYLRLRSDTPRHSVILLDEPELHLNPRLVAGLPDFYYQHLCVPQDNQLWLITHSDALLRHAIDNPAFTVLHMTSATVVESTGSQATRVSDDGLDAAVLSLVGDVSAYRPAAKVVVLEGAGEREFDKTMIQRLFPDFASRVNLISGGSKNRVHDIYATLTQAAAEDALSGRFFAIVDRDFETGDDSGLMTPDVHRWDRYHIENYLLEPTYLARAIASLDLEGGGPSEAQIQQALRACATRKLPLLVSNELAATISQRIVGAVVIKGDPQDASPSAALRPAIAATFARLGGLESAFADISELEDSIRSRLSNHLHDESFIKAFPGRDLIKALLDYYRVGVKYERFVALVINEMVRDEYQPSEMAVVLRAILDE